MFDNIEAHFHEGLVAAYRHYKELKTVTNRATVGTFVRP